MTQTIPKPAGERGQVRDGDQLDHAPSPAGPPSVSDGGHAPGDALGKNAAPLAETIAAIRAAHRERVFWMEQRKRSDLALGSYLRSALGWSLAKPPAEREAIRAQASEIMAAAEKHVKAWRKIVAKAQKGAVPAALPDIPEIVRPWAHIVLPQIEMRGRVDELETAATKAMTQLAGKLPVSEWASDVRGFGPLGLAIIVGEAGDLGNYANPGKLWKRMGVAVIDGTRQGAAPKGVTGDARAAAWIERGYNPSRRSRLYTIGIALIMAGASPYRQLHLDRKAYERARAEAEGLTVAPAGKIPKAKQSEYRSLGHIDNRSRRYVEKRLLRDLWKAWRGAISALPECHEGHAPRHAEGPA